jgi:hypothetical protein
LFSTAFAQASETAILMSSTFSSSKPAERASEEIAKRTTPT